MKLKLKDITHEEKTSQNGKQYTSCKLVVWSEDEQKNVWISGFGSYITKSWQAGDEVEVDVSKTDKGYWNFTENKMTKASPTAIDYLKEISEKLSVLIGQRSNDTTQASSVENIPLVAPNMSQGEEATRVGGDFKAEVDALNGANSEDPNLPF